MFFYRRGAGRAGTEGADRPGTDGADLDVVDSFVDRVEDSPDQSVLPWFVGIVFAVEEEMSPIIFRASLQAS